MKNEAFLFLRTMNKYITKCKPRKQKCMMVIILEGKIRLLQGDWANLDWMVRAGFSEDAMLAQRVGRGENTHKLSSAGRENTSEEALRQR